jgi:type II secretory pathway pseudopilin PulG
MRTGERGLALLGLLFMLVALGVAMATLGTVWRTAAQREKEKELLFVGEEYRHAIAGFWRAAPQGQQRMPKTLDELLRDPRFPNTVRYLRRLYRDPMTGGEEWGVVKDDAGGIAGVYSLLDHVPMKQAGFTKEETDFEQVDSYQKWVFQFRPSQTGTPVAQPHPALAP